jgi:hypothetical protein
MCSFFNIHKNYFFSIVITTNALPMIRIVKRPIAVLLQLTNSGVKQNQNHILINVKVNVTVGKSLLLQDVIL